jgi:hypothetical protein
MTSKASKKSKTSMTIKPTKTSMTIKPTKTSKTRYNIQLKGPGLIICLKTETPKSQKNSILGKLELLK